MSDDEQRNWVAGLGKTRQQQLAALAELLRHANADDMSREDRVICRAQIDRLHREQSAWRIAH